MAQIGRLSARSRDKTSVEGQSGCTCTGSFKLSGVAGLEDSHEDLDAADIGLNNQVVWHPEGCEKQWPGLEVSEI